MKKIIGILFLMLTVWFLPLNAAEAESGKVLQTQDSNFGDLKVQMTECKRKGDTLTIKLNFYNPTDKELKFCICDDDGGYWGFYVIAGKKKYFILKDSEGTPLAPVYQGIYQNIVLPPKGSHKWWGKFAAPPKDIKTINFIMPGVMPFEDIPITDE